MASPSTKYYFMLPKEVLLGRIKGKKANFHDLFQPNGTVGRDLGNGMLIIIASELRSAHAQEMVFSHPQIARLQHPVNETTVTFTQLMANPNKKFTQAHLDALASLGINGDHTVTDLHHALVKHHGKAMGILNTQTY